MTDEAGATGPQSLTDPRLLSGSATDFESSLLRAAVEEAPTAALSAKMLAPLATGAAATAAASGIGILKWAATGAGVLLVGGAYYLGDLRVEEPRDAEEPVSAVAVPRKAPEHATQEDASQKTIPPVTVPSSEVGTPQEAEVPAPSVPSSKRAPSSLAKEMQLLDEARLALRVRKNPAEALRLLGIYESRYPSGALRPEATVLRVAALEESGADARADALKTEFLKAHPKSAHKKQLENGSSSAK